MTRICGQYHMTPTRFRQAILEKGIVTEGEARKIVEAYKKRYPAAAKFLK